MIDVGVAPDGKIWFGEGFSAGSYDPFSKKFSHYQESGVVWSTYWDSKDHLWLAKFGGGLRRYDPVIDDFIAIGMSNPNDSTKLIHPMLSGIFQDSSGKLWLGSNSPWMSGFFRFDPETEKFETFDLPEAHAFVKTVKAIFGSGV